LEKEFLVGYHWVNILQNSTAFKHFPPPKLFNTAKNKLYYAVMSEVNYTDALYLIINSLPCSQLLNIMPPLYILLFINLI